MRANLFNTFFVTLGKKMPIRRTLYCTCEHDYRLERVGVDDGCEAAGDGDDGGDGQKEEHRKVDVPSQD
jgi:hypothetical protein